MSAIHLSPYINFQGKAREALEFYQRALGGDLTLYAMDEQGAVRPAGPDDRVAMARLESDGALILGSDGHPKFPPTAGDNMAITLRGVDRERISQALTALAEGGKLKSPLRPQPWGGETGFLEDKFGVNWMVTVEPA
jgi:PhnB protein